MKRASKRTKRNKDTHAVHGQEEKPPLYCTQCGATLEGFATSGRADDLSAIRKNFELCKKTGKFTGEFCSKLFIASPIDLDTLLDDMHSSDDR